MTYDIADEEYSSSRLDHSALFTAYNVGRRMARQGFIDAARLNRALGVAQANEARPYTTTTLECDCPDRVFRLRQQGLACKHTLALILRELSGG